MKMTAIFTGSTGCGKSHLALDLIKKEYNKHFDCIIIYPMLRKSKTYQGLIQKEKVHIDFIFSLL